MVHGELHGGDVVVGDERRVEVLRVAVDEHDRQVAVDQALVRGRASEGVGVHAGDEDDPADAVLEQHLDVVVLVEPPGDCVHRTGV